MGSTEIQRLQEWRVATYSIAQDNDAYDTKQNGNDSGISRQKDKAEYHVCTLKYIAMRRVVVVEIPCTSSHRQWAGENLGKLAGSILVHFETGHVRVLSPSIHLTERRRNMVLVGGASINFDPHLCPIITVCSRYFSRHTTKMFLSIPTPELAILHEVIDCQASRGCRSGLPKASSDEGGKDRRPLSCRIGSFPAVLGVKGESVRARKSDELSLVVHALVRRVMTP